MKYLPIILLFIILASYRPFGDVNGDYKVTVTDLVIMHRIVNNEPSTVLQRLRADLNRDGIVDEYDLKILLTYLVYK